MLASGLCAEFARITSTVCRWSVQGAVVVKRSESLDLVDSRCYVDPKKGRSLIGPKDGQDGWICRTLRNADRKRIRFGPHIIVAIRKSRPTIPDRRIQINIPDRRFPDRHSGSTFQIDESRSTLQIGSRSVIAIRNRSRSSRIVDPETGLRSRL